MENNVPAEKKQEQIEKKIDDKKKIEPIETKAEQVPEKNAAVFDELGGKH